MTPMSEPEAAELEAATEAREARLSALGFTPVSDDDRAMAYLIHSLYPLETK